MNFILWILCVVGVEIVGMLSAAYSDGIVDKYRQVDKPPFSPPSKLFGIVWLVLYGLMGTALYLVIASDVAGDKTNAYWLFAGQLFLNFIFSIIFFGLQKYWLAALDIGILITMIFFTIGMFSQFSIAAASMLVPYLVWCFFAAYLTIGVAIKNGEKKHT